MTDVGRDFDRWVILSLRLQYGSLWLEYRDETGARRSIPRKADGSDHVHWRTVSLVSPATPIPIGFAPSDAATIPELARRFQALFVPRELEYLLQSGFADFADSRNHWTPEPTPHSENVPWLLPVFVLPPRGLEAAPWEHLVQAILFNQLALPDRLVVMRLARETWKVRPPFTLPLTILDASDPPADWLASIRSRRWYAENDAVRDVGVRLKVSEKTDRGPAPSSPAHVILERISQGGQLAHDSLRRDRKEPQLIVAFNESPLDEVLSRSLGTLSGRSLLIQNGLPPLPDVEIETTIMELVYTLVHDFALHEALWIIRRARPHHYFLLATDPAANHALRLSRVMRRMVDETLALTLPSAGSDPTGALEQAMSQVGDLAFDFSRESRGLTDMSRLLAGPIRQAQQVITTGRSNPALDARRQLARSPARRADFAIEEYSVFGVLTPMRDWTRQMPLRPGWRYRLRVHIGQPDKAFSVVEGEVPAIDPLLPHVSPDEGHDIDVAVFEKTFGLLSEGVQTLHLPPFGGSRPVYFELRTPSTPGPADLRIALYYADNLLQSFALEAEIASVPSARASQTSQVRVRLTSSGTRRFGNLHELGARALSVALNDDVRGTHTLMLKRGKVRESIALTEKQIEQHMGEFRKLLGDAINANSRTAKPLFLVDAPESPERNQRFEDYLRSFARIGHGIWKGLLELRGVDTDALLALRTGRGETVQFVRHGKLLPFPWQTIYDYPLPEGDDFRNARVCFADTPVLRDPGRRETGCPHHPGQPVVCIEGFWSVRHCVEQLTEDRDRMPPAAGSDTTAAPLRQDRVTRIDVPPGNPLVCLGIGNDDLPARRLEQGLAEKLGKHDLRILTAEDDPLEDLLWKTECRPGLLIVLSHLEPADAQNNRPARLHAVVTKPPNPVYAISESGLLEQKLYSKEWTVPRSFVLLMACESAQVQLKDLTNLVDTFFGVGAGAVAGTECDVISDLAADFAQEITLGLTSGNQSLGTLLRTYTTKRLKQRNPLPFAFSVFGSAELTVGRPQS